MGHQKETTKIMGKNVLLRFEQMTAMIGNLLRMGMENMSGVARSPFGIKAFYQLQGCN